MDKVTPIDKEFIYTGNAIISQVDLNGKIVAFYKGRSSLDRTC
jgi:hypothetical protein